MFDEDRPKLKLEKTTTDYYIEYATFGLLALSFFYTIYHYRNLPDKIPMHFNFSGKVDRYGSKDSIWALNIIGAITIIATYYLNKVPHIFNYPKKITIENAKKQYTEATKMLRYMNLGIAIIFTIICYQIIAIAIENRSQFDTILNYILIGIILFLTLFPFVYIFKNLRDKQN